MNLQSRAVLPILLLVSGFCGISYEILYAKLLGNLLGDRFTISAAVLLTFLAGIGIGTLFAHRFVRWLWAIEAGIGIYAAVMVAAYDAIDALLYSWLPTLGTSMAACAAVSIVLLAPPAFLVGCSVPLFAAYLSTLRSTQVFSLTYGVYNFGAGLTALTMEFALLRVVGLRTATLLLALLNGVVAVGLLALVRTTPLIPPARLDRLRFGSRNVIALALASVASAIFQLMMIKVAEFVFGPYNETFSLVLAAVLMGLAVGSFAAGRLGLTFGGALVVALGGLVLLLGLLDPAASIYASLYPSAVQSSFVLSSLKFGLVLAMMGLPAVGFGATIPALLRTHRDVARESGELLFVSSMANALGFLLMAFVLHRMLDYGPLILLVAGVAAAAVWIAADRRMATACLATVLALVALGSWRGAWSEALLYFGHTAFHSAEALERARERHVTAERYKGPVDVFAITHREDGSFFFINGYISIPLESASEKIVGALSSLFAPRLDRALVLGVGSGATAGTVGLIFDRTDAVEINKVVLDNLYRMEEYNFGIEDRASVSIVHDDGIHFIKTTPDKYSLVLNTVTTPLYFSSSKLYTRDFFRNVVEVLEPDGVYTTWVDRKIGDRGVDIILETLADTFDLCWLTYLKSSYFLLVCSNAPVGIRHPEEIFRNPVLREFLEQEHELVPELIPYSILSTDALSLREAGKGEVNTLDYPVLEHEMARLGGETRLTGFKQRMIDRLDLHEVARAIGENWSPAEFALWADRRLADETLLAETLEEVVPAQFGEMRDEYAEAALRVARRIGSADAYYRYGRELYKRRICSAAIPAFEQATRLDPTFHRALYYTGRCYERQGNDAKAVEYFRATLDAEPEYDKAQEALDRLGGDAGIDPESPEQENEDDDSGG